MATKALSALEICRIIRTCAQTGVTNLSLGGLSVTFGSESKLELPKNYDYFNTLPSQAETTDPLPAKMNFTEEDLQAIRGMQEAQVLLDSPIDYEQHMIDDQMELGWPGDGETHSRGSEQTLPRG